MLTGSCLSDCGVRGDCQAADASPQVVSREGVLTPRDGQRSVSRGHRTDEAMPAESTLRHTGMKTSLGRAEEVNVVVTGEQESGERSRMRGASGF